MGYDKKSFLAGLSAGTQLKGWATRPADASGGLQNISLKTIKLRTPPILPANLSVAQGYSACTLNTPGVILIQTFEEVS